MGKAKGINKKGWKSLTNAQLLRYLLLFALTWVVVQVQVYFKAVLTVFICLSRHDSTHDSQAG